ncbi:hypothetical protein C8R47DRAFT_1126997 [Mycena vitilis]|nr:hypothetical protein C8R47DRAFT_1126997 [Mycena vitilis]
MPIYAHASSASYPNGPPPPSTASPPSPLPFAARCFLIYASPEPGTRTCSPTSSPSGASPLPACAQGKSGGRARRRHHVPASYARIFFPSADRRPSSPAPSRAAPRYAIRGVSNAPSSTSPLPVYLPLRPPCHLLLIYRSSSTEESPRLPAPPSTYLVPTSLRAHTFSYLPTYTRPRVPSPTLSRASPSRALLAPRASLPHLPHLRLPPPHVHTYTIHHTPPICRTYSIT